MVLHGVTHTERYAEKKAAGLCVRNAHAKNGGCSRPSVDGLYCELHKYSNERVQADIRRRAKERLGAQCVRCASALDLEFDHVNNNGKWHRISLSGTQNATWPVVLWIIAAELEDVLYGKYAIQLDRKSVV